jgi:hypothetical protein
MPSDRPNSDDIALCEILSKKGVNRSPRTCLRWRREGVLLPPSGHDNDGEPIFSDAAIERAVTYADLLDKIGHDLAVIVLWGNEEGRLIPKQTILEALRRVREAQLDRAKTVRIWLDPEAPKHKRRRRELQLLAELHHLSDPNHAATAEAMANALTEHSRRQILDQQEIIAASERAHLLDGPMIAPRLGEARADLAYSAADALVEGYGSGSTSAEIAEALGCSSDVARVMEDTGGPRVISDQLRTIDACLKDDTLFSDLIDLRDELRAFMISNGSELGNELGVLGPLIAGLDPVVIGQFVVGMALHGLTLKIEELNPVK